MDNSFSFYRQVYLKKISSFYAKHIAGNRRAKRRIGLFVVFFVILGSAKRVGLLDLYRHPDRLILSPFAIRAGERQSLPPMVLDMAKLALKHNIRQFNLSEGLLAQPDVSQHVVAFIYPIKMIPSSDKVFALVQENMPAHYYRIDTVGDIVLYGCRSK